MEGLGQVGHARRPPAKGHANFVFPGVWHGNSGSGSGTRQGMLSCGRQCTPGLGFCNESEFEEVRSVVSFVTLFCVR